jgi:transcriptional regulator with XRE-family HTH domain
MASRKLPNYIRRNRKRLGLSQRDIAFLLGWRDTSQPSRYEHFYKTPALSTALALAVIFQISVHDLFPGEKEQAENSVLKRAQVLETQLQRQSDGRRATAKLAILRDIISLKANRP